MTAAIMVRSVAVGRFLALFRCPIAAPDLDEAAWDDVVRVGRKARLLAALGVRLGAIDAPVPAYVRTHIDAETAIARHRAALTTFELAEIARALAPLGVPLVALKGSAYLLQDLPHAHGRLFADVDVLVPATALDAVERALVGAGWELADLDPYDQAYYRRWSHELPPLRFPTREVEVDVHHALLPLTGRVRPDPVALLGRTCAVPDSPYRVLSPEDQVLHACAQLFQDSDCIEKLRELADIDGMLRAFGAAEGFWTALGERAQELGLSRPLWYASRYASAALGTPLPAMLCSATARGAPPALARRVMHALLSRTLLPADPDAGPSPLDRWARRLTFARSHWLRMPPALLAWHAAHKLGRRWQDRETLVPRPAEEAA